MRHPQPQISLASGTLEESGIEPSLLERELTKSILISNIGIVLTNVMRLKALGVNLSADDFGTGYSSLSYLKRFEVDRLKIDQSFVRDLASDAEDAVALARLRVFGCDLERGYFFARPMSADELMSYLDEAALALP